MSLKFLHHVFSFAGVKVDTKKTKAVQGIPVPQNMKDIKRLLGSAGWYHHFVPRFSQLNDPLKETQMERSQVHLDFCISGSLLHLSFIVYTNGSDTGLGAILAKQTGLGAQKVLPFTSHIFDQAEQTYLTTEQECLAAIWALEKWKNYFEGSGDGPFISCLGF